MEFLTPYQATALYEGVIAALPTKRSNFLQSIFPAGRPIASETVAWDKLQQTKNVMGIWVAPTIDVDPVRLPEFSHKQSVFAYTKEAVSSPSFDELNQRAAGDPIGYVDIQANLASHLAEQFANAEMRIQNLFEYVASKIILEGKYETISEKHEKIVYDFERTVTTTEANLNDDSVLTSQVDLTTLNANGGVGKRAWGSTGGTVPPTPVKDFLQQCQVVIEHEGSVGFAIMSNNAYTEFNKDLTTNYASAANLSTDVLLRVQLEVLPTIKNIDGLTYRRSYPIGNGQTVDIYTYDGYYHTRSAGTKTRYIPAGYSIVLPPAQSNTFKFYGRIKHPKANYAPLPRFINHWSNEKTGFEDWEIHSNFLMGTTNIDSFVCWKVMA